MNVDLFMEAANKVPRAPGAPQIAVVSPVQKGSAHMPDQNGAVLIMELDKAKDALWFKISLCVWLYPAYLLAVNQFAAVNKGYLEAAFIALAAVIVTGLYKYSQFYQLSRDNGDLIAKARADLKSNGARKNVTKLPAVGQPVPAFLAKFMAASAEIGTAAPVQQATTERGIGLALIKMVNEMPGSDPFLLTEEMKVQDGEAKTKRSLRSPLIRARLKRSKGVSWRNRRNVRATKRMN